MPQDCDDSEGEDEGEESDEDDGDDVPRRGVKKVIVVRYCEILVGCHLEQRDMQSPCRESN